MRKIILFIMWPIIIPAFYAIMWWETNINRNPSGGKTNAGPYAFGNKPSLYTRIKDYLVGKYR